MALNPARSDNSPAAPTIILIIRSSIIRHAVGDRGRDAGYPEPPAQIRTFELTWRRYAPIAWALVGTPWYAK